MNHQNEAQAIEPRNGRTAAAIPGASPTRISPIDDAMDQLRNTQGATLRLLEDLATRLDPVLQVGKAGEAGVGLGDPHASPLHGDILGRAGVANDIHRRICDLIERLTL